MEVLYFVVFMCGNFYKKELKDIWRNLKQKKISYAIFVTWIFFSWLQIQSGEGPTRELPQVKVCRINHC